MGTGKVFAACSDTEYGAELLSTAHGPYGLLT